MPDLSPIGRFLKDSPAPGRLLFSADRWEYPAPSAPAGKGRAGIRSWQCPTGVRLVVVTELGDGVTVTNAAEDLRAAVRRARWGGPACTILEWWPATVTDEPHLDLVTTDLLNVREAETVWARVWPTGREHPRRDDLNAWAAAHARTLDLPL